MDKIRTRNYRLLLYTDNHDMMRSFKKIQRDAAYNKYFVGIWHTSGKKHAHLVLHFDNARSWAALCDDLKIDSRFCRPIGYKENKKGIMVKCSDKYDSLEGACCYLTHINTPDKEQYEIEKLFGSKDIILLARKYIDRYASKELSQADCLLSVRRWIVSHYGEIITPMMFIGWITGTRYMKVASNAWVTRMIDAHNQAVYNREMRISGDDLDYARQMYEKRRQATLDAEFHLLDISDFKPLIGKKY